MRGLRIRFDHDSEGDTDGGSRIKEIELLAAQYRLGVETQMHFNELILRTRTLGMYGALLVMGTALFLRAQVPAPPTLVYSWPNIFSISFPTPALVALFGPVLLVIVYLIDVQYYLRLHRGASTYVYTLERQTNELGLTVAGVTDVFRQGLYIQAAFRQDQKPNLVGPKPGKKERSNSLRFVNRAYMLVAISEIIVVVLLWVNP